MSDRLRSRPGGPTGVVVAVTHPEQPKCAVRVSTESGGEYIPGICGWPSPCPQHGVAASLSADNTQPLTGGSAPPADNGTTPSAPSERGL